MFSWLECVDCMFVVVVLLLALWFCLCCFLFCRIYIYCKHPFVQSCADPKLTYRSSHLTILKNVPREMHITSTKKESKCTNQKTQKRDMWRDRNRDFCLLSCWFLCFFLDSYVLIVCLSFLLCWLLVALVFVFLICVLCMYCIYSFVLSCADPKLTYHNSHLWILK